MRKVVGIDGCKDGWIAAVMGDGRLLEVQYHNTARAVIDAHSDAEVFAFDIPIGLSKDGKRVADAAARNFLYGRTSVVFNAPARVLLHFAHQGGAFAQRYALANAESKRIANQRISSQNFALFAKISEVDLIKDDSRIFEAHPEVSFAELGGGQNMPPKRSWNGLMQRKGMLRAANLPVPGQLGEAGIRAAADDIVDAVACAWTAGRIASGTARTFPNPPEQIEGRQVAIWC